MERLICNMHLNLRRQYATLWQPCVYLEAKQSQNDLHHVNFIKSCIILVLTFILVLVFI